jgi:hypothetical protein
MTQTRLCWVEFELANMLIHLPLQGEGSFLLIPKEAEGLKLIVCHQLHMEARTRTFIVPLDEQFMTEFDLGRSVFIKILT